MTGDSTPAQPRDLQAERYGRKRRRQTSTVLMIAMLAIPAITFVAWLGMYNATTPVHWSVLTYTVTSDRSVEVTWEVVRDPGDTVTCVVRSRDRDGVEIGREDVTVPAGDERRTVMTHEIRTADVPNTGEVRDCEVTEGP